MSKRIQHVILTAALLVLLFTACQGDGRQRVATEPQRAAAELLEESLVLSDSISPDLCVAEFKSATAIRLDSLGLVNITELDSSIVVSLLYATPDNFTGEVLYDDLTEAYLHPEAADALLKAKQLLKAEHAGYTLIIYDATRPMSVQRKMWDLVKGTSKNIYVSNPARGGGLHNYGLAVDISILDITTGTPLSMGTEVDHLGPEAHITSEAQLVKSGILTQQEKENRELLRKVMRGAGFRALHSEWWHFNLYSREVAKKNYTLIE